MSVSLVAAPRSEEPGDGATLDEWVRFLDRFAKLAEVIDGLFDGDGTVIVGAPYAGKTQLALAISACLAGSESTEFFGRPVDRTRLHSVAYVATDPGAIRRAVERLTSMGVPSGAGRGIRFYGLPGVATDTDAWARWADELHAKGVTVVVLDNLMGTVRQGEDFDKPAGAAPVLERLRELRARGFDILVVSHPAKGGGTTPLGSVMFDAFFRRRVNLTGEGARRQLTTRSNDGDEWSGSTRLGKGGLVEVVASGGLQRKRDRSGDRLTTYRGVDLSEAARALLAGPDSVRESQSAGAACGRS